MTAKPKRGGKRPGSGKPPIHDDGVMTKVARAKVSDAEHAKFMRLGGSAWLRKMIAEAA